MNIVEGENLSFEVSLVRLFNLENDSVNLNYFIKNKDGETFVSESETKIVEVKETFIKAIEIPKNLDSGKYVLYVQVNYEDNVASASVWFNLFSKKVFKKLLEFSDKNKLEIVGTLILLTIILIAFVVKRTTHNEIKTLKNPYEDINE